MTGRSSSTTPGDHGIGPLLADDGGLQAERTALAWRRTAASFAVAAAMATRLLARTDGGWAHLAGVVAGLCVVVVMAGTLQRSALLGPGSARRATPTARAVDVAVPGWMAAVAVLTTLGGLAAATAVLTGTI